MNCMVLLFIFGGSILVVCMPVSFSLRIWIFVYVHVLPCWMYAFTVCVLGEQFLAPNVILFCFFPGLQTCFDICNLLAFLFPKS